MRSLLVALTFLVYTPLIGGIVLLASLLRAADGPRSVFAWAPRAWTRRLVRAAGVRVRLHGFDAIDWSVPRVVVANHVSWFDVFVLASVLPRAKFVAKAELERIPIFGPAVRACGFVFIDRENRKAAFESYRAAAVRMQQGASVVVFPEGTRGPSYPLRAFKKGPFVLAIAAQAPVVPTAVHGTLAVQSRERFRVRAGAVDVHFLPPIPTAGLDYADRDALAAGARSRIATALHARHGVPLPADLEVPAPV
jgi:1-acyl-sn-glycerol-3-phosphate acyltransferase